MEEEPNSGDLLISDELPSDGESCKSKIHI